jgi:DNA-binding transcriptional MerR regulator
MKTKIDEYVRVKQAAEMLGLSPNTVRKWGALGKIPEFRHPVNTYRLYRRSDLERLVARVERTQTQPKHGRRLSSHGLKPR